MHPQENFVTTTPNSRLGWRWLRRSPNLILLPFVPRWRHWLIKLRERGREFTSMFTSGGRCILAYLQVCDCRCMRPVAVIGFLRQDGNAVVRSIAFGLFLQTASCG